MHIITELFQVESCTTLFTENFKNNKRKWEIVDTDTESALINKGFYFMDNKCESNWNYYKIKTGLTKSQHFLLDAVIHLEKKDDQFGHFGLVWGFDKNINYLNRFSMSADGKRLLIMNFEKDHRRIVHRFHTRKLPHFNTNLPLRLSIVKLNDYFHFLINKQIVYIGHQSLFENSGSYAGFYVEPGLSIKSNFFEVKKISARALDVTTGLQQLMSASTTN